MEARKSLSLRRAHMSSPATDQIINGFKYANENEKQKGYLCIHKYLLVIFNVVTKQEIFLPLYYPIIYIFHI